MLGSNLRLLTHYSVCKRTDMFATGFRHTRGNRTDEEELDERELDEELLLLADEELEEEREEELEDDEDDDDEEEEELELEEEEDEFIQNLQKTKARLVKRNNTTASRR